MTFGLLLQLVLAIALIVMIAMNAKRVGNAAWALAALPMLHVVLIVANYIARQMATRDIFQALELADAGFTLVTALIVVIACALLR